MKRIILLYASDRPPGHYMPLDALPEGLNNPAYIQGLQCDGIYGLIERAVIGCKAASMACFIDTRRAYGKVAVACGDVFCVPNMDAVWGFIQPGDIVIVRGGARPWYNLLDVLHKRRKNWMLFYRANSNFGGWPFWDCVLNDFIDAHTTIKGILHYAYHKPVCEDIFQPQHLLNRPYDVCVGASHIHRQKGQHTILPIAQAYEKRYGKRLRLVVPGGGMKDRAYFELLAAASSGDYEITLPGHLTRHAMATLYNQCSVFAHLGVNGQTDRSVLEAMQCGIPVLLRTPRRFAPFISAEGGPNAILNTQNPEVQLRCLLAMSQTSNMVHEYYQRHNGFNTVAYPVFKTLLDAIHLIGDVPQPEALARYFK